MTPRELTAAAGSESQKGAAAGPFNSQELPEAREKKFESNWEKKCIKKKFSSIFDAIPNA